MKIIINNMNLNITGLILLAAGSIILALNTDKMIGVSNRLLTIIQRAFGFAGMGPLPEDVRNSFLRAIKYSRIGGAIGYFLFISGFILQLIYACSQS
jgi:hypothetical protein